SIQREIEPYRNKQNEQQEHYLSVPEPVLRNLREDTLPFEQQWNRREVNQRHHGAGKSSDDFVCLVGGQIVSQSHSSSLRVLRYMEAPPPPRAKPSRPPHLFVSLFGRDFPPRASTCATEDSP